MKRKERQGKRNRPLLGSGEKSGFGYGKYLFGTFCNTYSRERRACHRPGFCWRDKTPPKQLVEKSLFGLLWSKPIKRSWIRNSNQAGIWRLELIQKSWRSTTYWLAHPGFLSLLPYSTLYHQARVVPPTVSWVLPHQSSDQNTHYSFAHRPFLNWGSLLQKDSSLCWVDIKVTSRIRLGVRQLGDKFISQRTKLFCLFIESGLFHYINWTNAVYFLLKQLFLYGHINFTNHLKK